MATASPVVVVTQPVSHVLDGLLSATINKIATEKKGYMELDVTLEGAEVEVGHRFGEHWVASAYASRVWTTKKQQAGVRLRGAW